MKLISNLKSIKKITSLLLLSTLVLFFTNCSNDELIEPENAEEKVQKRTGMKDPIVLTVDGFEVSEEAAVLVAQNFAAINARENGRKDIEPPTVRNINRIEDEVSKKPLLYIIEYTKGFSIVSADTRYNPILAYSDKNPWGGVDVAGPDIMIKRYSSAIKEIKAKGGKQDKRLNDLWSKMCCDENKGPTISCDDVTYIYGPYVEPVASWRQGGSNTTFTPNKNKCGCGRYPAGCGPLALSALMTYHQSPVTTMTFNGETISTDYANWSSTTGPCSTTDLSFRGPAMLARLCGSFTNTNYGVGWTCNTATYPWNIGDGLDSFGYTHDGKGDLDDRYNAMKSDLENGRPVIISGTTGGLALGNWHIWLVDGFMEINFGTIVDNECYIVDLMHMTWGWGTSSNGWFWMNEDDSVDSVDDYDTYMRVYTDIRP